MRQEEALASLLKKFNTVAELKAHMNTQTDTCSDAQRHLVSYLDSEWWSMYLTALIYTKSRFME